MNKWILTLLAVALVASPAFAFRDVPANHWAYDAINKAVDQGILQGYNNMFHGKKTLNRFQMAVVVARMLDRIGTGGGGGASPDAIKQLEALVTEFADELALLNVKVGKLEEQIAQGGGSRPMMDPAPRQADPGKLKIGGVFKNWYQIPDTGAAVENEAFNVRNARLILNYAFTDDVKLFAQTEHAGSGNASGGDVLDFVGKIKLPNNDTWFEFGRQLAKVGYYHFKHIGHLDFIQYPIVNFVQGTSGAGIWRQNGFYLKFNQTEEAKTKLTLGVVNGNVANSGAGGVDDDEKGLILRLDHDAEKFDLGFYYHSDEVGGGGTEYTQLGLFFKFDISKINAMVKFDTLEWEVGATTTEADSLMAQFIIPMTEDKTDLMLRWEQIDFDAGLAGDWDRITLGFRWKMDETVHWQLEYWDDELGGGGTPATEPSFITIQLMAYF